MAPRTDFLAFSITPDGGLDITDKATGEVYRGLGHLYDVEDAGDEYSYCPAAHSETVTTAGGVARIALAQPGPVPRLPTGWNAPSRCLRASPRIAPGARPSG